MGTTRDALVKLRTAGQSLEYELGTLDPDHPKWLELAGRIATLEAAEQAAEKTAHMDTARAAITEARAAIAAAADLPAAEQTRFLATADDLLTR